jgi:hypothetical protein
VNDYLLQGLGLLKFSDENFGFLSGMISSLPSLDNLIVTSEFENNHHVVCNYGT